MLTPEEDKCPRLFALAAAGVVCLTLALLSWYTGERLPWGVYPLAGLWAYTGMRL